jgi:signal transduction histidine kinase
MPVKFSRIPTLLPVATAVTAAAAIASFWTFGTGIDVAIRIAMLAGVVVLCVATRELVRGRKDDANLETELARLREKFEQMLQMQERFVGNIAHEFKTPLSTAVSHAELLIRGPDDASAMRRRSVHIVSDILHLADLLDAYLRLTRPFSVEDARMQHQTLRLHDHVLDAVRRAQPSASDRGVRVVTTLAEPGDADPEVDVVGDPQLLTAMLENLVRNSVRHSPRNADVEVSVSATPGQASITVRDHGPGIRLADPEAMFPWYFLAPDRNGKPSGVGFGLAIARRIAVQHSGTLNARTHEGGGCEFAITLPRLRGESRLLSAPTST